MLRWQNLMMQVARDCNQAGLEAAVLFAPARHHCITTYLLWRPCVRFSWCTLNRLTHLWLHSNTCSWLLVTLQLASIQHDTLPDIDTVYSEP